MAYLEGVGESQWAGLQWTAERGVDIRRRGQKQGLPRTGLGDHGQT